MNDYLNNLISRTLNPAHTLKPRLPSRYELPGGLAAPSEIEVRESLSSAVPVERSKLSVPVESVSPSWMISTESAASDMLGSDLPKAHIESLAPDPISIEYPMDAADIEPAPVWGQPARVALPVQETELEPVDGLHESKREVFVRSQRAFFPAVRTVSNFPSQPNEEKDGPTIRVTIGRVEVRVPVQESSAAKPKSPTAPARLSLDEYLKRSESSR